MSEAQRDLHRSRPVLVHPLQRIAQTGVRQSDRQNVHDLMLDLDPLLDDHQGGNAARSEQRRRGEPEPAPQGVVPVPRAPHTRHPHEAKTVSASMGKQDSSLLPVLRWVA